MGWEAAVLEEPYHEHVDRLGLLHPAPRRRTPTAWSRAAMTGRDRRRPLVGDRRPDPAPDARPAAHRRRGHRHQPERAAARSPARPSPSTSACWTGSAWSTPTPTGGRSATGWTTPSSPEPSRSCPRSARPGTPGCSGSSGSPRRSSAPRTTAHDNNDKEEVEAMVDILHRVGVETASPDGGLRGAHHGRRPRRLVDRRDDRRPRGRRHARVPVHPRRLRHGGRRARARRAGPLAGRRRPAGVGRHARRAATSRQVDDYTIVLFKHEGWEEPVEFMHHCSTKWAIVPDEPQVAGRDRHRRARAARRR